MPYDFSSEHIPHENHSVVVDLLSVDIGHGGQRVRCLVPLPGLLVLGRRSLEGFRMIIILIFVAILIQMNIKQCDLFTW